MATINPMQQYKEQSIETATPGMLIVMLFEGAIKNINIAIKSINEKNIENAHNAIIKAENIYIYIADNLDERFPISKNLKNLYSFVVKKLVSANMKKDSEGLADLREALEFTVEFRDTWKEAEKKMNIQKSMQSSRR